MRRTSDGEPRSWYSPHRAIVFLGVLLTVVAVAGGALGVVNSSRAEALNNQIIDQYLVLLPPVREIRTSVADFQALEAEAFGTSTPVTTFVPAAVADSNAIDKAYLSLRHLLALPDNAGLAPALRAQMTAFVSARLGLEAVLAGVAQTPQSVHLAAVETSAAARLDTTLAALQTTVTNRLVQTANQARAAANRARIDLLMSITLGVLFAGIVTTLLTVHALRVEHEQSRREAIQSDLTRRIAFEARLQRALEMSKAEGSVFDLVAEALSQAAPDMRSELLLADTGQSRFRQVLVSTAQADDAGCGVMSPADCPAASRGQSMVFPSSTAIDACPNLRGRGCSALCVPVSISGDTVGVFHVTTDDGSPPSDDVRENVEVVARRASERLAMLRAFELSQAQANSDSLTGLLTRRSLETSVRKLQDTGTPYSVAYGDLDHFKDLNDMFGHDAGDRALRIFSQVLRDSLRPADIPCRYGGEEFVIVLPECPVDEARQVLDRVRQRIAVRIVVAEVPTFTVSFGLASSDQADDFQQVVSLADSALLSAKAGGRDRIVVSRGPDSASPGTSASVGTISDPWDPTMLPIDDRPIDDLTGDDLRLPQHH